MLKFLSEESKKIINFLETRRSAFVYTIVILAIGIFFNLSAVRAVDDFGLSEAAKSGGLISKSADVSSLPTPQAVAGTIIGAILAFVGVIFLVLTIYGGFLWMTAGGNPDQIKKAKGLIVNSIIGLVIVLAAYAIVSFVLTSITGAVAPATP